MTDAVVKQLHRSGMLGSIVKSYCDRREMQPISPVVGDEISRSVGDVIRSKQAGLVRRNRVDIELVEVARFRNGAVLTSETGIHALARARHVPSLDLVTFFAWAVRLGLITADAVDVALEPWRTTSASGTGCPADFAGSLDATVRARGEHQSFSKPS